MRKHACCGILLGQSLTCAILVIVTDYITIFIESNNNSCTCIFLIRFYSHNLKSNPLQRSLFLYNLLYNTEYNELVYSTKAALSIALQSLKGFTIKT